MQKGVQMKIKKITGILVFLFLIIVTIHSQITSRVIELKDPRMNGNDLYQLQKMLVSYGFNLGETDGWFGPKTKEAVIQFQEYFGLEQNGKVDKLTWNLIFNTVTNDLDKTKQIETYLDSIKYINTFKESNYDKIEVELYGYSTEGGVARIYKKKNAIYCIQEQIFGERGQYRENIYFLKDRLVIVKRQSLHYPQQFDLEHASIETNYYYDIAGREKYEIINGEFIESKEDLYNVFNIINQYYLENNK